MANSDDPRYGGNKRSHPSGISSAKEEELSRKIHAAHSKALDNERRIQELEKTVNDKSQWNNTVRGWIGTKVRIRLTDGYTMLGVLRSVDRYTMEIEDPDTIVIHKGAVAAIWQVK